MEKIITKSAEETKEEGKKLGLSLMGGDVVALFGDLGSGKTTFVQGLAQGVGVTRRIVSPTFLVLKTYPLKKEQIDTFYHADLYRIENVRDVESIGLQEILHDSHAISVIEWPEKIESLLPKTVKKIKFSYLSDTQRSIRYE